MTEQRRTHRSHVSYIDKSREFYGAHGYEAPYAWAANDDAPFTKLTKPLSESRIGLVTTAYFLPEDFVYRVPGDLPRQPSVATMDELDRLNTSHLSWAKDETHTDDFGSYIPFEAMGRLADSGRIGSVSPRIYCQPTQFSHRMTQKRDTPKVLEWMAEDDVDLAVMVPL